MNYWPTYIILAFSDTEYPRRGSIYCGSILAVQGFWDQQFFHGGSEFTE